MRSPRGLGRTTARAVLLASFALAAWAPAASATFHMMKIREVYPGSSANPQAEYVELQMYAPGQILVSGHSIVVYNAAGIVTGTDTFGADMANGANQSTIVAATPAAESQFGIVADGAMTPGQLDPSGGAVCWESFDCVSWGTFSGSPGSPAGNPADPGGIPDGMALRRTIARGCPTLLEGADDTDNSAADFSNVFPTPRPNSVTPAEHACSSPQGPGGSGGGAPQTVLKRKPAKTTHDRTPTFRFGSSEAGSTFQCKLDHKSFHLCYSPYTTARLSFGRHTFKVRARNGSGNVDPSPASYSFRVVKRR